MPTSKNELGERKGEKIKGKVVAETRRTAETQRRARKKGFVADCQSFELSLMRQKIVLQVKEVPPPSLSHTTSQNHPSLPFSAILCVSATALPFSQKTCHYATTMKRILKHPQREITEFFGMVTASDQMKEFFELIRRVSRAEVSVLIRGESGTGKELVAQAIHALSRRSQKPFRAVNCATFTSELLASELFGHVRGAFTGAVRERKGLFEWADKGMIFLDEVAEIPLEVQARLLRVLQEQRFVPVGATESKRVDVRVISATNKALRREVAEGRFREDLMYRIRVVPIFLPTLVEREGDVELLAWHFIEEFNKRTGMPRTITGISSEAFEAMLTYRWPGNIRELRNVIEYAFVIGDGNVLRLQDLTPELRGEPPPGSGLDSEDDERRQIEAVLLAVDGHRGEAAERLGISRTTLWRRMKEMGIEE